MLNSFLVEQYLEVSSYNCGLINLVFNKHEYNRSQNPHDF